MTRSWRHYFAVVLCVIAQITLSTAPAGSALCLGCTQEPAPTSAHRNLTADRGEPPATPKDCCCQDRSDDDHHEPVITRSAPRESCCVTVVLPTGTQRLEPRSGLEDQLRLKAAPLAWTPVALPLGFTRPPLWREPTPHAGRPPGDAVGLTAIRLII